MNMSSSQPSTSKDKDKGKASETGASPETLLVPGRIGDRSRTEHRLTSLETPLGFLQHPVPQRHVQTQVDTQMATPHIAAALLSTIQTAANVPRGRAAVSQLAASVGHEPRPQQTETEAFSSQLQDLASHNQRRAVTQLAASVGYRPGTQHPETRPFSSQFQEVPSHTQELSRPQLAAAFDRMSIQPSMIGPFYAVKVLGLGGLHCTDVELMLYFHMSSIHPNVHSIIRIFGGSSTVATDWVTIVYRSEAAAQAAVQIHNRRQMLLDASRQTPGPIYVRRTNHRAEPRTIRGLLIASEIVRQIQDADQPALVGRQIVVHNVPTFVRGSLSRVARHYAADGSLPESVTLQKERNGNLTGSAEILYSEPSQAHVIIRADRDANISTGDGNVTIDPHGPFKFDDKLPYTTCAVWFCNLGDLEKHHRIRTESVINTFQVSDGTILECHPFGTPEDPTDAASTRKLSEVYMVYETRDVALAAANKYRGIRLGDYLIYAELAPITSDGQLIRPKPVQGAPPDVGDVASALRMPGSVVPRTTGGAMHQN